MFNRGKHTQPQKREKVPEDCLRTERLQVERKMFFFDLKENPRGRYLRITEDANGQRDFVILPVAGLQEFHEVIGRMLEFQNEHPCVAEEAEVSQTTTPGQVAGEHPAVV